MKFITITFATLSLLINHKFGQEIEYMNQKSTGIYTFLQQPQNYTFLCTSTSKGEVLSANLDANGNLEIDYSSFWDDGDHSGKVSGKYDHDTNQFKGKYQTNDGRFSGEINFSFNDQGEANGTWDNGYGVIKIHLKK